MLYWLTLLSDGGDFLTCFAISLSARAGVLTALVFGFLFGKPLIEVLRKRQGKGQPIRNDGPEGILPRPVRPPWAGC